MKKHNKKGFTIVELVIVIAVIAILAAVLIPTFSSVIKKAKISSDTQLCKNMNTALDIAKADGAELDTMEDVLFAINEAGYVVENLNPTTEGFYYAWDKENDNIVFLDENLTVYYPEGQDSNPAECVITVGNKEEANTVAAAGYDIYLEPSFADKDFTLESLVDVDGGATTDINLTIEASTTGSMTISGNFASVEADAAGAHIEQFGTIKTLTVTAVSANTFVINGFVKELKIAAEQKVEVKETGIVVDVVEGNVTSNAGVVGNVAIAQTYEINNKADLYSFRDTVNAGYDFAGKTVELNADIDLAGVAWLPIGNVYRDFANVNGNIAGFAGTFDGNNHIIKNLSNKGFSVDGLASGRNSSSVGEKYEVVFGLFGCVKDATIKNLTVNANISDVGSQYVGDSVGAIVGYAYGQSLTIDNCKSTGVVNANDGVGGIVGRSYVVGNVSVTNCTNTATVLAKQAVVAKKAAGKAGGIIGYINGTSLKNGYTETIFGYEKDKEGNDKLDKPIKKVVLTLTGCVNTGVVTTEAVSDVHDYAGGILTPGTSVYVGETMLPYQQGIDTVAVA